MVQDVILLIGCVFVAFGVVRILVLMSDRSSPLSGILYVLIGSAMVFYVYTELEGDLELTDIPQTLFRVLAEIF